MLALYDAVLAALAADPATRQDALSSMTVIGRASGASAARSRANGVGAEWPG